MRRSTSKGQRGQSMVEATLVLLVFFALLMGVVDCGQVLFAHQSLVERVRTAVRWGAVHPYNGSQAIVNLVLYNQPQAPAPNTAAFLGLRPENVEVRHQASTPDRPDDESLRVTIVNFKSQFFSPWIARALVSPRAVSISAPMAYRTASNATRN